mgnify:FL=1|jgi:hypothetical protein|tara:strand:- start:812 stop:1351 length:540 start_codon:yes stop_codon:yes gene_type:complete
MKEKIELNIHQKIALIQSEIGAISKDTTNPFYKSKYFDINSLIGQLHPLLEKYNLVLLQPIADNKVNSIICDTVNKEEIHSSLDLPTNLDPQKLGSAITYFRRYTLQSLLALQAEDDDGNKAITKIKPTLRYKDNHGEITKEFQNALNGMRNGKTINDIQSHYKLDSIIKGKLLNFKID